MSTPNNIILAIADINCVVAQVTRKLLH